MARSFLMLWIKYAKISLYTHLTIPKGPVKKTKRKYKMKYSITVAEGNIIWIQLFL